MGIFLNTIYVFNLKTMLFCNYKFLLIFPQLTARYRIKFSSDLLLVKIQNMWNNSSNMLKLRDVGV